MTDEKPQGCLTAILSLLGIRLGPKADSTGRETLPYRLRDDFLSPAERSFLGVLQMTVRDQAVVCPKVNLGDVFFVTLPNENRKFRNKIDRKHVDFLVCDPRTMRPLFGVELDDKSHSRADRAERDEFVDELFQAAGLPLLRQPVRAAYDPQALAARLASFWAESSDKPAAATVLIEPAGSTPAATAEVAPICPKCGIPMVERKAAKGPNAGKAFWGCPNFPRCREVG
jgi:hypothetical protein